MVKRVGGRRRIDIHLLEIVVMFFSFASLLLFPSNSYADSLSISKDSYINKIVPNTNYGSSTVAYVGLVSSWESQVCRTFISFPFSTAYSSLCLNLYCTYEDPYSTDLEVSVYPVSADWSEGNITWNNQPTYSTSYSVTYTFKTAQSAGKWHQVDITGLLPYWTSNSFYGVVIVANPEVSSGKANHVNLATRESTCPPYITYAGGTAPSVPVGLSANATGPTQVRLSWQPNTEPDLAGYIIYRDYVEIARVGAAETSYTDNSVQSNKTYTYGIKAYDSSNNVSDMSNAATVTTPPELAAPTGLTAANIAGHVQLSWTPNTEPTLAGYIIYRDYVEIARVGAADTSYTDNSVQPNTTYTYGIKAYSASGFISDMSNAATITTPATPKPILTIRVDGKVIRISWTDSGSGYIYKVLINGTELTQTSSTSWDYTASGPGYYTVQVVAVAPSGEQFPSDKAGVTISALGSPSASTMAGDLLANTGLVLVPAGSLLALYLGLKGSPIIVQALKALLARRL